MCVSREGWGWVGVGRGKGVGVWGSCPGQGIYQGHGILPPVLRKIGNSKYYKYSNDLFNGKFCLK